MALRKLGKDFVECSQTLDRWSSASWLTSPVDSLGAALFRRAKERRQRELSRLLLHAYSPLLASLNEQFGGLLSKEAWLHAVWSSLWDSALIGGRQSFSMRLWRVIRLHLPGDSVHRWEKKFLLFPFFAEMEVGEDKDTLWVLIYGGNGPSPPREEWLMLLNRAYGPLLDTLNRFYEDLRSDLQFTPSDLQAVESRDMDRIDSWMLAL